MNEANENKQDQPSTEAPETPEEPPVLNEDDILASIGEQSAHDAEQPEPKPDGEPVEAALDPLEILKAEAQDLRDQLLRTLAEMENLRRRSERERADTTKYAVAGFARDLLSPVDNLRRALEAVPEEARKEDEAVKTLLAGVELTERELLTAFEKHGLRKIEPLGEPFDHNYHQAMFEVPGTDQPNGTVVQLLQPGYVLHDRLIRPAMVGVAKAAKDDTSHQSVDTTA